MSHGIPSGTVRPSAVRRDRTPVQPNRIPSPRPTTSDVSAMRTASAATMNAADHRDIPMARSRAVSRLRSMVARDSVLPTPTIEMTTEVANSPSTMPVMMLRICENCARSSAPSAYANTPVFSSCAWSLEMSCAEAEFVTRAQVWPLDSSRPRSATSALLATTVLWGTPSTAFNVRLTFLLPTLRSTVLPSCFSVSGVARTFIVPGFGRKLVSRGTSLALCLSTPTTWVRESSFSSRSCPSCTDALACTPGRVTKLSTASDFLIVSTALPEADVATTSMGSSRLSSSLAVTRVVCAPTRMVATKVTPTKSAEVVEAVRRGDSLTLRATRPKAGERKIFSPARPITATIGGTNTRLSTRTPLKARMPPGSARRSSPTTAPSRSAATPIAVRSVPTTSRIHGKREAGAGMSAGASASMGDTRVALSAGQNEAITVTVTPTARPRTVARRVSGARAKVGWKKARAASVSATANPQPTKTPRTALMRPRTAPSARVALRS